jgi:hypothetical protein
MSDAVAGKNEEDVADAIVSHAGEQKYGIVAHIREKFTSDHKQVRVFVDEWSLKTGARAMERIWGTCQRAPVGEQHSCIALDSSYRLARGVKRVGAPVATAAGAFLIRTTL